MQPIEKYGVIALIFLVIVVVAAYVWDGEGAAAPSGEAAAAATELARGPDPLVVRARTEPRPVRRRAELMPEEIARARALIAAGDELPPGLDERIAALSGAERGTGPEAERGADEAPPREAAAAEEPRVAKPVAPPRVADERIYVVRKGDTLSEISERRLGTSKRWREIVDLNPGLDPAKLREGVRLVMPEPGVPVASASDAAPPPAAAAPAPDRAPASDAGGATHVVRANESLWAIAARRLGDGDRWREIAELNPEIDPNRLAVGAELRLPSGARSARAEEPPTTVASAAPAPSPKAPASAEKKGVVR